MLYPHGSVDYAVGLPFLHCTKKVRDFLNDQNPSVSSTSLSVLRSYSMMKHGDILFLELEDRIENNQGEQEEVRIIFWRESSDDEPSAALLLAADNETRTELYGRVKQLMETSVC
jgi:hypothetical protein